MSNPIPSRSLRLSPEALEAIPDHCKLWYEGHNKFGDARSVEGFTENFPLETELLSVYLGWGWESAAFKIVLAFENQLIRSTEDIRDEAIEVFKEHRKYDNRNPVNLGISMRVRQDTFGPRLNWVRFVGKASGRSGTKRYFTEPVKLAGKYRTSSRIFQPFPEDIRAQLLELEDRAVWIRYQTEKLNRLKQLCFEPPHAPP